MAKRNRIPKALQDLPESVQVALAPLLPRQQQFVLHYCGDCFGNGTASAKASGYTPHNAHTTQWELRRNPKVAAAIDVVQAAFAMSPVALVARVGDLATVDASVFFVVDPVTQQVTLDPKKLVEHGRWVKSIEVDPLTMKPTKIHLHDPQRAQATLGRFLGLDQGDGPRINFHFSAKRATNQELIDRMAEVEERHAVTNQRGEQLLPAKTA